MGMLVIVVAEIAGKHLLPGLGENGAGLGRGGGDDLQQRLGRRAGGVQRLVLLGDLRRGLAGHESRNAIGSESLRQLGGLAAHRHDAGDMVRRLEGDNLVHEGRALAEAENLQVAGAGLVEHLDEAVEIGCGVILRADRIDDDDTSEIILQNGLQTQCFDEFFSGGLVHGGVRIDEEGGGVVERTAVEIRGAGSKGHRRPAVQDHILGIGIRDETASGSGYILSDFASARLGGGGEARRHRNYSPNQSFHIACAYWFFSFSRYKITRNASRKHCIFLEMPAIFLRLTKKGIPEEPECLRVQE